MTRRDFLTISATVAAGATLAACAPAAAPGAGGQQAAAAETVELRFAMYSYEPWLRLLEQVFQGFEEQNEGVTVSLESAPWEQFWPKLEAQAMTGEPPNISITERFENWGAQGWMLDISPTLELADPDIFFPGVTTATLTNPDTWLTGAQSGGNVRWAFPGNGVAAVVYLNMDLLEAAGLEYPDPDWTWDDFKQYAIQLTLDDAGRHPGESDFNLESRVQFALDEGFVSQKNLKALIWQAGGRRWNEERTECLLHEQGAMDAIRYMHELIELGVMPAGGVMEGVAQPFLTGQIAMHVTGSWNIDTWATELTDFVWDVQRMPMGPAGQEFRHSHSTFSNPLGIFKEAPNQEQAIDLFRYALMTQEGSRWFGTAGIPCVRAAAEDPDWLNYPDGKHIPAHREVQLTVIQEENYQEKYSRWIGYAEMEQVIQEGLDLMALGRMTPEEYVNQTCENVEAAFERIHAQFG
jgi:multiple sugar transport system substrate-binding protein